MGKAARLACITIPMLCTLTSLIATLILVAAGTNKGIKGLNNFYMIQVNLVDFNPSAKLDAPGTLLDGKIPSGVSSGADLDGVPDYINSYLWNYCWGDIHGSPKSYYLQGCKKSSAKYALDIEKIVDSFAGDDNAVDFPSGVRNVQKAINVWSRVTAFCYAVGLAANAITFIVGWFGLLSRWGSCVTTIFASMASALILVASIGSTALSYSLHGALSKVFDEFGVDAVVGRNWMAMTWVAAVAAGAAGFFWFASMCCCSGRTKSIIDGGKGKKGTKAVHQPYTYQRMGSQEEGVAMGAYGRPTSYGQPMPPPGGYKQGFEPMRHQ